MLIIIKENNKKKHRLRIPTRLIFNNFTALIAPKYLNDEDFKVTPKQLRKFFKVIHKCRRSFKKWDLAEVESSDGDYVRVRL